MLRNSNCIVTLSTSSTEIDANTVRFSVCLTPASARCDDMKGRTNREPLRLLFGLNGPCKDQLERPLGGKMPLNNQIAPERRHWSGMVFNGLPPGSGVLFEDVTLDERIGAEAAALLIDPEPDQLLANASLNLNLKAGIEIGRAHV